MLSNLYLYVNSVSFKLICTQITEEVAQRMTNRYGKSSTEAAAEAKSPPSAAAGKPAEQRAPTVSDIVNPNPPPPPPPATSGIVAQTVPPSGLLTAGTKGVPIVETITAYEVRQQKDQELRDNDAFWASKLKELEARVSKQFNSYTCLLGLPNMFLTVPSVFFSMWHLHLSLMLNLKKK